MDQISAGVKLRSVTAKKKDNESQMAETDSEQNKSKSEKNELKPTSKGNSLQQPDKGKTSTTPPQNNPLSLMDQISAGVKLHSVSDRKKDNERQMTEIKPTEDQKNSVDRKISDRRKALAPSSDESDIETDGEQIKSRSNKKKVLKPASKRNSVQQLNKLKPQEKKLNSNPVQQKNEKLKANVQTEEHEVLTEDKGLTELKDNLSNLNAYSFMQDGKLIKTYYENLYEKLSFKQLTEKMAEDIYSGKLKALIKSDTQVMVPMARVEYPLEMTDKVLGPLKPFLE